MHYREIVVPRLPGDVERNTSWYTDFTVGEAKTSFARQGYRGNWGFFRGSEGGIGGLG